MRRRNSISAFTLIELLVVIGIISVLISLLMAVMPGVREQGKLLVCTNNLRQIYFACIIYANENRDRFPDGNTLGGHQFRRGMGLDDPVYGTAGVGETLGMPATLQRMGFSTGGGKSWICPDQPDWMAAMGNTYAWSISSGQHVTSIFRTAQTFTVTTGDFKGQKMSNIWVWDNFNQAPGIPDKFGKPVTVNPLAGNTFSPSVAQHRAADQKRYKNTLFMDGQVGLW